MKNKIQQLIRVGLSKELLKNLSEGQVNQLHRRMISEQVTPLPPKPSYKVGPEGGSLPKSEQGYAIKKNEDNSITATPMESELGEDDTVEKDPFELSSTQDKRQVGPSDYGDNPTVDKEMDSDDADGMGMMEEKTEDISKEDQKEMVDGIIEIVKKVKDINNRKLIVKDMIKKFKKENIKTDIKKFMKDCGIELMGKKETNEDMDSEYVLNATTMGDALKFKSSFTEEKKDGPNPWAICTSSVGRKNKDKFERCVKDVKRNVREGKNPYQVIVEMSLEKMVEKHVSPRMTKGDLLKTLSEQGIIRRPMTNMSIGFVEDKMDKPTKKSYTSTVKEQGTKTAPPVVKPGTKEKPKTSDPFKNPKHQPKPKAKANIDEQGTQTAPPVVKPGTKEKPKTSDPFKNPKHQPKPKASTKAPKMGTVEIPDYLTFDQLKINFKDQ